MSVYDGGAESAGAGKTEVEVNANVGPHLAISPFDTKSNWCEVTRVEPFRPGMNYHLMTRALI